MSSRASTPAPIWSSSIPAAFSTAPRRSRLPPSAARLKENGKVIVTGCMGAEPESITAAYPNVLAVTGPQQYESVVEAVHRALPPLHDPFLDLVPPEGIKLTPRHYAYLKISEGCNNRCTFCIIPRLRGDLVSRPAGDVLREAEKLVERRREGIAGHLAGHFGLWARYQIRSEPMARQARAGEIHRSRARARRTRRLGAAALRLPLPARRRCHPADGGGQNSSLSRHPVPACRARRAQAHEAPRRRRRRRWSASPHGARSVPTSRCARPLSSASPARPTPTSNICCSGWRKPRSTASAASVTSRCAAPPPTTWPRPCRTTVKEQRWHRFMQAQQKISARRLKNKVGARQKVIIDSVGPTVAERPLDGRRAGNRRRGLCGEPAAAARRRNRHGEDRARRRIRSARHRGRILIFSSVFHWNYGSGSHDILPLRRNGSPRRPLRKTSIITRR